MQIRHRNRAWHGTASACISIHLHDAFDFLVPELQTAYLETRWSVPITLITIQPFQPTRERLGMMVERNRDPLPQHHAPSGLEVPLLRLQILPPTPPPGIAAGCVKVELALVERHEVTAGSWTVKI